MQAASPAQVLDQIERNQADWGRGAPALLPRSRARPREKVRRLAVLPRTRLGAAGYLPQQPPAAVQEQPETEAGRELRRRPRSAAARVAGPGSRPAPCRRESRLPGCSHLSARAPQRAKGKSPRSGTSAQANGRSHAIDAERTCAQVLAGNLEKIGLKVDIKTFPPTAYFAQIENPRAAFDIAGFDWLPDYIDPASAHESALRRSPSRRSQLLALRLSPLQQADARYALRGQARYQAYADLDLRLSRDAAPFLIIGYGSDVTFVSNRVGVGCLDLSPYLDLAAVCLK